MAKNSSQKILFVTTDFPPDIGGLQTYSMKIIQHLPLGMLGAVIAGTSHKRKEMPPLTVPFATPKGTDRFSALCWSLILIPWMKWRFHLSFQLHMQWSTALPSLMLKKLGFSSDYLILIHGAEIVDSFHGPLYWVKKAIFKNASAVISGSLYTKHLFHKCGFFCNRIEQVYYGIDLNPPFRIPSDNDADADWWIKEENLRLLCIHRLVRRKGTEVLLYALNSLKFKNWKLLIAGEGDELAALLRQIHKMGLESHIRFIPFVEEGVKHYLMRKAHCFILPSLSSENNNHVEGLGLTLLESQLQGTPVIAANTGGIPEAMEDDKTGLLFRAGDPKDLKTKLEKLMQNSEQFHQMGGRGPDFIKKRFSWKKNAATLTGIIRDCFIKKDEIKLN